MSNLLKIFQRFDDILSYLISGTSNERKLLKKILKKRAIIVDIGANVGGFIDFSLKNLKIKKIYAFEPSYENYKFLKNKFKQKNIHIINKGVAESNRKLFFFERSISSQSSFENKRSNFLKNLTIKSKKKIDCVSLDNFNKSNNNELLDLVKIDCEGFELRILKGLRKLLKKKRIKLLKVEINNDINDNDNLVEILKLLDQFNYKLFTITKIKFKNEKLIFFDAYFKIK